MPSPLLKPKPQLLVKRDRRREAAKHERDAFTAVAIRDGRRCRCCGRSGQYDATTSERALHRHHLVYRSRGGSETTANLITLCAFCHAVVHAKQLWPIDTDANQPVRFEIHEAAVVEIFGTKPLPPHVRIVV